MAKVVRGGVGALGWIATAAGVAGIALHFSRVDSRITVLAASGAPYLMLCAVVGLLIFGGLRSWKGTGVALVVVAAAVWTQVPLYVGRSGDGTPVTVMQSNLLFDGADPRAVVDQVRNRRVEVLTVDELTPAAVEGLHRAGLDEILPHRHLSPGRFATGTGIWSRYPLADTMEYDGFVLNQLSATVQIPQVGPVSVYAFHPVPPVSGVRLWSDELTRLGEILGRAPSDRPVIVGGDFNATYDHYRFRALASGRFADAAEQAGAGHLVTYPTDKRWPALIGIDHILVSGGHATDVVTVDLPGADHRALVARVELDSPN